MIVKVGICGKRAELSVFYHLGSLVPLQRLDRGSQNNETNKQVRGNGGLCFSSVWSRRQAQRRIQ